MSCRKASLALLLFTVSGLATAEDFVSAGLSVMAGPGLTISDSYDPLPNASAGISMHVQAGSAWGLLFEGGALFESASMYSDTWYRYRGFFALTGGLGPHVSSGPVDVFVTGGGILARYLQSWSYFWFPYLNVGVTVNIPEDMKNFNLEAGLSVPVYFRRDTTNFGLKATVTLMLADRQERQVLQTETEVPE